MTRGVAEFTSPCMRELKFACVAQDNAMACCILISGIIGVLLSIKARLLDRRRSKNIALQWRLNPESREG